MVSLIINKIYIEHLLNNTAALPYGPSQTNQHNTTILTYTQLAIVQHLYYNIHYGTHSLQQCTIYTITYIIYNRMYKLVQFVEIQVYKKNVFKCCFRGQGMAINLVLWDRYKYYGQYERITALCKQTDTWLTGGLHLSTDFVILGY